MKDIVIEVDFIENQQVGMTYIHDSDRMVRGFIFDFTWKKTRQLAPRVTVGNIFRLIFNGFSYECRCESIDKDGKLLVFRWIRD